MKKYSIFLSIFVVYILICMIVSPELYMHKTFDGITAWALNVLPSVLPFIFFTKILANTGITEKISVVFKKPCQKILNTPPLSAYVFLLSAISGYPVGAKITADLYLNGTISKNDAFKMTSFCSTSGPMFIIGAVGVGMLHNAKFGYLIFISHILGALLNGVLYRKLKISQSNKTKKNEKNVETHDLSSMVTDSALSILSIGVIIAIFFVVITSLAPLFNLLPPQISSIGEGLIEITKGCTDISLLPGLTWKIIACTFIISFGGISTIFQSITMLNKLNMPIKLFILQKITHAICATIICSVLCFIL